jgi:hypothetical protein
VLFDLLKLCTNALAAPCLILFGCYITTSTSTSAIPNQEAVCVSSDRMMISNVDVFRRLMVLRVLVRLSAALVSIAKGTWDSRIVSGRLPPLTPYPELCVHWETSRIHNFWQIIRFHNFCDGVRGYRIDPALPRSSCCSWKWAARIFLFIGLCCTLYREVRTGLYGPYEDRS